MTDSKEPAAAPSLSVASLRTYRDFAAETLLVAGRQTLEHFRGSLAVDDKSTRAGAFDPVTAADRGAEQVIRAAIRQRWPDHGIIGEEGPDESARQDGDGRMGWTIDPVDGTRSFICGFVHWGMLLALTCDGRPVLGAVHQPWTGEFWSGSALGGEFRRGADQRRLATRACPDPGRAVLASTDPYLFEGAEAEVFDALRRSVRLTRFGADCYAYCMLAMGQIDLVVESGLSPWDVQALMPIVEAAGGVITDWSGGDCSGGGQVLAAGDPALHGQVLERLCARRGPDCACGGLHRRNPNLKLEGIRVIDLSLFLPGPTATLMMADHGAEVIKIESLGEGEPNRHIGQRRDDVSVYFDCTHRGKKSLALNLKSDEGRDLFMRLVDTADVVVEAFRPGVVDRLGVGPAAVRARNPRIVYASISAFGQTGPLVPRPAHDLAVEAMCGLLSNNLGSDGQPALPAMPSGDMLAATLALAGISMALLRRTQTGAGDYLDLAMMDSILACMPNSMGAAFGEGRAPVPAEERIWGGNAFYRIYRCADGEHVVLGGVEMKFVKALLGALGRDDLVPLCARPGAGQAPVVAFLETTFASRTRAEWEAFMADLDVCFAPVNDLRTGLDLAQTRARHMVLTDEAGREHLGVPLKFEGEPAAPRLRSPAHGEHSRDLLAELGVDDAAFEGLRSRGIC